MTWGFQTVPAVSGPDLLISEYIEGSSNNKALEIYNPTAFAVTLSEYTLELYSNGSGTPGNTLNLGDALPTLDTGAVLVIANASAVQAILDVAHTTSSVTFFNGDDALVLKRNGVIIDVLGVVGSDPGSEWGSGDATTLNHTLRRLPNVCIGDINGFDNPADISDQWAGFPSDTFDGLGTHFANCDAVDNPPTVQNTIPANGAGDVALSSSISITFSEPVTVSGTWFELTCNSVSVPVTVSGGTVTWTLTPDSALPSGSICGLNVIASQVTDQDGTADPMTADYSISFGTVLGLVCDADATLIHDIQGSGLQSLVVDTNVVIEGVVVGDYQDTNSELSGFFVQEEDTDADADPTTSEGIFIYDNGFGVDVNEGDLVRLQGTVSEFETSSGSGQFLTEIGGISNVLICGSGYSVTPTTVNLPVSSVDEWERYEGMLINIPQTLTVSEVFNLGRFGQVTLSAGRLFNPTHLAAPGAPALAQLDLNNRSRIELDDASSVQNSDPTLHPPGGLSADNTLRQGYTLNGVTGVLDHRFSAYRIQPVDTVTFNTDNPRTSQPNDVGSAFKVASFNVLNYFNGDGLGGGFPTSRGASTATEFDRQRDKIIAAIDAIDAAVVGLMEIENDGYGPQSAVQDLVNGLNSLGESYSFIDPGVSAIGTDEIAVAIIYQTDLVTPVGNAAILDSSVNPLFIDTKNRPALAQTFMDNATGSQFTVIVNHLKSKGSACDDVGDPDQGDGQGTCNLTRTNAAQALADWLASDPTGTGVSNILIIGDLNSYAKEDPITTLKNAGFTNLLEQFQGDQAYSYTFFGESGYLDHALASTSLVSQVTGVTEWHINTDEPIALDYNVEFKSAGQVDSFYNPDPYRASDHDPVIVGLDLTPPITEVEIDVRPFVPVNLINLNSAAKLPVAILSSASFDATTVNANTVEFAGAPAVGLIFTNWPSTNLVDVNWDGRRDLVLYFSIQDMDLTADDNTATLTGETYSGQSFTGTDTVLVIPPLAPFLIHPEDGDVIRNHRPIFHWRSLGATCYAIEIASDADFNNIVQEATVVISTIYRADYLPNGTYFWRVKVGGACNIAEGEWGGPRSFEIRARR